jgi:hypothetical protein
MISYNAVERRHDPAPDAGGALQASESLTFAWILFCKFE